MSRPRPQQTKTISTIPSIQQLYQPIIHSYHRYQTLLHYFNSFMTDFKMHIVELKQLVYGIVGVMVESVGVGDWGRGECQVCEVEFLMRMCRTASQDVMRVLGLLRGYTRSTNKTQTHTHKYPQNHQPTHKPSHNNFDNSQNICPNTQKQKSKFTNPNEIQIVKPDNIGFLTFRENQQNQQSQFQKYGMVDFKNMEDKLEVPNLFHLRMPTIQEQYWEKSSHKQQDQTYQDSDQNFQRAYQLINLIKQQVIFPANNTSKIKDHSRHSMSQLTPQKNQSYSLDTKWQKRQYS